jgi:RHS repeat-associated protein
MDALAVRVYDADANGSADLAPIGSSTIANPYTYTGRRLDAETGLYQYRNRYYHAQLGRFVSRDPIGYEGSWLNHYEYVGGSPLIYLDPWGLEKIWRHCMACHGTGVLETGATLDLVAGLSFETQRDIRAWNHEPSDTYTAAVIGGVGFGGGALALAGLTVSLSAIELGFVTVATHPYTPVVVVAGVETAAGIEGPGRAIARCWVICDNKLTPHFVQYCSRRCVMDRFSPEGFCDVSFRFHCRSFFGSHRSPSR